MAAWRWAAALLLAVPVAAAAQSDPVRQAERRLAAAERTQSAAERDIGDWTEPALRAFSSEGEIDDFVAAVDAVRKAEDRIDEARWQVDMARRARERQRVKAGQGNAAPPTCPAEDENCEEEGYRTITVTGSRIIAAPLTNNQEQGVDEGDLVKQIGQYLLVLQDGRIFVIDLEGGADRRQLVLVDRANVYRDPKERAWYDELVVYGDRIVVTGYAYGADASEIAVFRLGPGGRLASEGVFQIYSADYYDRRNYASRIVGDRLILYTPIPLRHVEGKFHWPTLHRAPPPHPDAERDELREERRPIPAGGRRLLRPDQLYRPLATLRNATIHLVTTCRLGAYRPDGDLGCQARGFVASRGQTFYANADHAYLWTYAKEWRSDIDEPPPAQRAAHPPAKSTRRSSIASAWLAATWQWPAGSEFPSISWGSTPAAAASGLWSAGIGPPAIRRGALRSPIST